MKLSDILKSPAVILPLITACILSAAGAYSGYYPRLNDFLDNHYLSMAISFNDLSSLYNGFFPMGYSLLLKATTGTGYPGIIAFFINIILSTILFHVMSYFPELRHKKFIYSIWLILLFVFPRYFKYLLTQGPDCGATVFFNIAIIVLFNAVVYDKAGTKKKLLLCITSGLLLGLSALFRYHALVAGFFLLASFFLFFNREKKFILIAGAAMALTYAPQMIISIISGHGPFKTYHAINICNLVYGVDWYHIEKYIPVPSVFSIISDAPLLFASKYLKGMAELAVYSIPAFVYARLTQNETEKKISLTIGVFTVIYSVFFAISASPRAVLILLPMAFLFLSELLLTISIPAKIRSTAAIIIGLSILFFIYNDAKSIQHYRNKNIICQNVETFFKTNGITDARQVYSSDYGLYFKSIFPYRPLFCGGWGMIATYRFTEFYPQIDIKTPHSFYNSCILNKIRWVVLNEDASKLSSFLEILYLNPQSDPNFELVQQIDSKKIFIAKK
jgi:hypothetical protein